MDYLVKYGVQRGFKYTIYQYPKNLVAFIYNETPGNKHIEQVRAKTLPGLMTKIDRTTRWMWEHENKYLKMHIRHPERYPAPNPLSSAEGIALCLALAGGVGAAIYYITRPATTTTV